MVALVDSASVIPKPDKVVGFVVIPDQEVVPAGPVAPVAPVGPATVEAAPVAPVRP